jgi:hypothetical protein
MTRRPRSTAAFLVGVATGLVLAAGGGVALAAGDVDGAYKKLRVFSQVLTYVQQSYVDEVDGDELVYDAVVGMLSGLDPHTVFMRPAEYEKLREDTVGEFGGLGIEVGVAGDLIQVEVVHAESPGAHAGLRPGDKVLAVDGESLRGQPMEASVRLMRGVPGTRVVLTVERKGWERPRDIPLVRRQVRVPSVELEDLGEGVAYVRIRAFQERTDFELSKALAELKRRTRAQGAELPAGLVLDLRDNPGGLLDEGIRVADRFLAPRWRPPGPMAPSPATRWRCWSMTARRRRARSWPGPCRTTIAPPWWAPAPSARARCRRSLASTTAPASSSPSRATSRRAGAPSRTWASSPTCRSAPRTSCRPGSRARRGCAATRRSRPPWRPCGAGPRTSRGARRVGRNGWIGLSAGMGVDVGQRLPDSRQALGASCRSRRMMPWIP